MQLTAQSGAVYKLEPHPHGKGGQSEVYRAEGPSGPCAVKIAFYSGDDGAWMDRERDELVRLKREHPELLPWIVELLDWGETPPWPLPRRFLVMEWLPVSLTSWLSSGRSLLDRLRAAELTCEAVSRLHWTTRGAPLALVHRDVKPDNALLHTDGDKLAALKLTDFGSVKRGVGATSRPSNVWTTEGFRPPDQQPKAPLDPSWDVYALGVTVYWCITQQTPKQHAPPSGISLAPEDAQRLSLDQNLSILESNLLTQLRSQVLDAGPLAARLQRPLVRTLRPAMAWSPQERLRDARSLRDACREAREELEAALAAKAKRARRAPSLQMGSVPVPGGRATPHGSAALEALRAEVAATKAEVARLEAVLSEERGARADAERRVAVEAGRAAEARQAVERAGAQRSEAERQAASEAARAAEATRTADALRAQLTEARRANEAPHQHSADEVRPAVGARELREVEYGPPPPSNSSGEPSSDSPRRGAPQPASTPAPSRSRDARRSRESSDASTRPQSPTSSTSTSPAALSAEAPQGVGLLIALKRPPTGAPKPSTSGGFQLLPDSSGYAPGQRAEDPELGIALRYVPPARFLMGSSGKEAGGVKNRGPQHSVTLTQGLWVMEAPVTQALYEQITGQNPSHFKGDPQRPVEMVSWEDAACFANALSERSRYARPVYAPSAEGDASSVDWRPGVVGYRLPTEAEWEHACRAGTQTRWSFGDDEADLDAHAWFSGNAGKTTHPVGLKLGNGWRLKDMHGNVWEWTWNGYGRYTAEGKEDPRGRSSGVGRVIRGGSWLFGPRRSHSASRLVRRPGDRFYYLGFRLVLPIPPDGA